MFCRYFKGVEPVQRLNARLKALTSRISKFPSRSQFSFCWTKVQYTGCHRFDKKIGDEA